MWFKNARAYRLTAPFDLTAEQLADKLSDAAFVPCGKSQALSLGWVPPLGDTSEALVHEAAGRMLLCLRREEKLLPSSVIREQLAERVSEVEGREARKVYRTEKLRLKDEIVADCLPRAFTRSATLYAYIDRTANWLFVDSVSAARAEELLGLLRECLGSVPLVLPRVNQSPAAAMSHWLLHRRLPAEFALDHDCDMKDPGEEGGVVRCRGIELAGEETDVHLQSGKQVVRLGVHWDEKLSFILSDDLCLRRLRFSDELLGENEALADAEPLARLDADFLLMSDVLTSLQDRMLSLFGGEATE